VKRKPRIYVAGPITKGNRETNVYNGIRTGDAFLKMGFAPFVPHYSHYHCIVLGPNQPSYEDWMGIDFTWILACDVLWRMEGESPGATREVRFANKHGIPVFYAGKRGKRGLDGLKAWQKRFVSRHRSTTQRKRIKIEAGAASPSKGVLKALA